MRASRTCVFGRRRARAHLHPLAARTTTSSTQHRFPTCSLLAAAAARPAPARSRESSSTGPEVWTRGRTGTSTSAAAAVGAGRERDRPAAAVACGVRQEAFCFVNRASRHERLARAAAPSRGGSAGPITVIAGARLYEGGAEGLAAARRAVGRVRWVVTSRRSASRPWSRRLNEPVELVPGLRCVVFGDGPERPEVLRQIDRAGLEGVVEAPGFVETGARRAGATNRALSRTASRFAKATAS